MRLEEESKVSKVFKEEIFEGGVIIGTFVEEEDCEEKVFKGGALTGIFVEKKEGGGMLGVVIVTGVKRGKGGLCFCNKRLGANSTMFLWNLSSRKIPEGKN